jgi:hypothetical protein
MGLDEVILRLISWELLGDREVCPKKVLREMSLSDLTSLENQIRADWESFLTPQMIKLEKRFRLGLLREDWILEEIGKNALLRYSPLRPGRAPVMLDLVSIGELG